MKLNTYNIKMRGADLPVVSVAGFGKTAQTNFLQIFNMMLKSVKKLAHRMGFPGRVGEAVHMPVKSAKTGISDGARQLNKGDEFFNLPAASVMPILLENLNISEKNQTNVRLSAEQKIDIVKTVGDLPAEQKNLPKAQPGQDAGIQNTTMSPEFTGKGSLTQNDLGESAAFEKGYDQEQSVTRAAQRGLVEGNSAENTRLSGNAQILRPASGNSEVIVQGESGHNLGQNKEIADLSTSPENLAVPASQGESTSSRPLNKTKDHTVGSPLVKKTSENHGKLRKIINRIFARKQVVSSMVAPEEPDKLEKINASSFIKQSEQSSPGEATVNISAKDPTLSGKAGKIISVESRIVLNSAKNTKTARTPEAQFSSSLKQSLIPENSNQSATAHKMVAAHLEQKTATRQNVKSFEQNTRFDEIKDNREDVQNTESRSHSRSGEDFKSFSNSARDLSSGQKNMERITRHNGTKGENITVKTEKQNNENPEKKNSGGIANTIGKTKEITQNFVNREKAHIVAEKPPADLPEQISRSAINRTSVDAENFRMPETIARVSLIQRVSQFIEQSVQNSIKRQFSLQMKTDDNELVEMRFVREDHQNRGKILVSSESMAQHLQRHIATIQDNLSQKGIQFAELTVQLHNSDDFRSGEKNMNSRKVNKKDERNLRTVESKPQPQQATVRTAYKYGYNTVEFIA